MSRLASQTPSPPFCCGGIKSACVSESRVAAQELILMCIYKYTDSFIKIIQNKIFFNNIFLLPRLLLLVVIFFFLLLNKIDLCVKAIFFAVVFIKNDKHINLILSNQNLHITYVIRFELREYTIKHLTST